MQEVLVRNTELISLHQLEEFGKGQNETPHVRPPPRILLSSIHLGWTRRAPPGRTPELEWLAKDNLETNPITIKPETTSQAAEQFSGSLALLLSTRLPFPNKNSCFVSTCVFSDSSFPSVRQEPSFGLWKGSSFVQELYKVGFGCIFYSVNFKIVTFSNRSINLFIRVPKSSFSLFGPWYILWGGHEWESHGREGIKGKT